MKISIIREDKTVVKDGVGIAGLTLSSIPADVWSVQWDSETNKGTVEKNDLSITEITSLGDYQSCVTEWDTKKTEIDAAEAALSAPLTDAQKLEAFKAERTGRLEASDWTQLSDNQLSDAKVAEWKVYRQALRDLPANTSDPANPTFPTKPS